MIRNLIYLILALTEPEALKFFLIPLLFKWRDVLKKILLMLSAIAVLQTAPAAYSGTAGTIFNVSATVVNTCRNIGSGNIDLGSSGQTDPGGSASGLAVKTFDCSKGTSYWVYTTRSNSGTNEPVNPGYGYYSNLARPTADSKDMTGPSGNAVGNFKTGSYPVVITYTVEY